jgi:hypothetical protein
MPGKNFTTSILVDRDPMAVFDAIKRPREWWGDGIEGHSGQLHEIWSYRHKDMHFSLHKTTELAPGRRLVWHVLDSDVAFLKDKQEWKGTNLVFDIEPTQSGTEVRFTHEGLVPEVECFDICTSSWSGLIGGSLKKLIEQGAGLPGTVVEPQR